MREKVKKPLKICLIVCVCLALCLVGLVFGINLHVLHVAKPKILAKSTLLEEQFDCILILGAGLWDGEPSPMLKERLDFGIQAYQTGCSNRMLMSGDHGKQNYDEVNAMKRYAIERGLPPEQIFLDHAGFSTYESMYRAKEIFKAKKVLIVTQKYHLYRAVYDAQKLGLDAYGFAAEQLRYPITNDVREAAARVKDFLWCIRKPLPTYLGEAIPISGDAAASDDKIYT